MTKSRAILAQGLDGTGSGWRRPAGGVWVALFWAQTEQAAVNSLTSSELWATRIFGEAWTGYGWLQDGRQAGTNEPTVTLLT